MKKIFKTANLPMIFTGWILLVSTSHSIPIPVANAGFDLKKSTVCFEAVGKPSFIKIEGEGTKLTHSTIQEKGGNFEVFEFALDDFKTGIDTRDEHMKEKYLQVKEFPTAQLKIPATDKSILDFASEETVQGTLTLHGQTKPVTVKSKKSGKEIDSEFEIKLTDFGIEVPEWAGITVADNVKIKTTFEASAK